MPELSISEFSSIAVTTGKPKITKIKKIANRGDYQFYQDYYLSLRTAIKSLFIKKRHISYLFDIARKQKTTSKKVNYEKIAMNFKDWQSGKNITAFSPPKKIYQHNSTHINCNPELNVMINGSPRLVKLHFSSSDRMTQERANFICTLMAYAIDDAFDFSVLDLTTGREYFLNANSEKQMSRIDKEIDIIQEYWD